MPRSRLLPGRLRVPALATAALCWIGVIVVGAVVSGGRGPSWWDGSVIRDVHAAVGPPGPLAAALMTPSDPPVVCTLIALLVVLGVAGRRWEVVALAVVAPALATSLTDFVLKPMFDRRYDGNLSYPSGHTASAVAVLTVALLAVASLRGRVLVLLAWLATTATVAVGLIGMDYHYPTDTIGGVAVALGTVVPCAVLADVLVARSRGRIPPRVDVQR